MKNNLTDKNVRYDHWVTLDTESNKDGSLYLLTTYSKSEGPKKFYNVNEMYDYLDTLGNILVYVHNYANWDSYFLNTEEVMKRYQVVNYLSNQKKLLSLTLRSRTAFIKFQDSYPRTMISIKDYAESIGKKYGELPDYELYRSPGKPETWPDRKEIELYAIKDVEVLYDMIMTFKKIYMAFDYTLSAGSMVWSEVIDEYNSNPIFGYKSFRKDFVELDYETDQLIRPSYMGGITTPFWNNGVELNSETLPELYPWFDDPTIYGEDISSAYAAAQIKPLPSGKFIYLYKEDIDLIEQALDDPTIVVFMNLKYKYDRAKFPLIPKMSMKQVSPYELMDDDEITYTYNEESRYMESMLMGSQGFAAINSIDLGLAIKESVYDNLEYEYVPFENTKVYGIMFKTKVNEPMSRITQKYYHLKNNASTKALRSAYKSPLVNLYGKTGERMYTEDRKLDLVTREYIETVKRDHVTVPRYSNVAVAAMITMYVHHELYYKAKEVGFKNMLYCDTDSFYYIGDGSVPKKKEEQMGIWNIECYKPERAIFISPKRYIIENFKDDKDQLVDRKTASAGISKEDLSFNIDAWNQGKRVFVAKVRVKTEEGIYLTESRRDISDSFQEGDQFIYKDWVSYE